MIFNIIITIWILSYVIMVIDDNTPCNNSIRKAFLFLSSMLIGVEIVLLIWAKYLFK